MVAPGLNVIIPSTRKVVFPTEVVRPSLWIISQRILYDKRYVIMSHGCEWHLYRLLGVSKEGHLYIRCEDPQCDSDECKKNRLFVVPSDPTVTTHKISGYMWNGSDGDNESHLRAKSFLCENPGCLKEFTW